ncbi:MAG: peptide ABC transporter substrate-binding protein [Deltaproteobacteria bacterium]|nr:peptide ABC transporter substrate-binding protein [Deltaproteobacteria bacterium]
MVRRLAGVAALLWLAGCGLPSGDYFGAIPDVHDRPRHLRFCNQGEPDYVDPAMATSTTALPVIFALFDGLTLYGLNGMPEPSLAERWDVSSDLRTFTFHLRHEGKFSNGRTIDAYDFAYQFIRILHPSSASPNADGLEYIKGAAAYNGNTGRVLLRAQGGLAAGAHVEIVGAAGKSLEQWAKDGATPPDANVRRGGKPLALRDLGAAPGAAYATAPAGADVTIIELTGGPVSMASPDGQVWAYVFYDQGDGAFGWVPMAELDQVPSALVDYEVRELPKRHQIGIEASLEALTADDAVTRPTVHVRGADLLMLPELMGMRIPDRWTFVVETAEPTPYLIAATPSRPYRPTPREAVSRSPRRWTDVGTIITSGPMALEAWLEKDRLELVRSKTFWNPSLVKLDRLTVFSMDDQAANANYYAAGGCDATASNNVPTSYRPILNGERRRYLDYAVKPYNGIYFAWLNTEKLKNRHLRRALAYAVDRKRLAGVLHGPIPTAQFTPGTPIKNLTEAELTLCGVTRDQPGVALIEVAGEVCYVPPLGLDFDPEKARAEWALARQELGADFPKSLTYRYNSGAEAHKIIAEYLQQSWKETLDFDVTLEAQEWKTFLADTTQGKYDMARFGNIGSLTNAESEYLVLFKCGGSNNRGRYCSPQYAALIAEAKKLTDRRARNAKLAEAEKVMIEDAPVIPIYIYVQDHLRKPYVRDLGLNIVDQFPIYRAWLDPDWAQHPGRSTSGEGPNAGYSTASEAAR